MKNEQTKQISTFPKSQWKIWFWGVILFVAVFIGIKEVSAQILPPANEITSVKISDYKPDETFSDCFVINKDPKFPGGEKAFSDYLIKNLTKRTKAKGRIVELAFVIEKDGTLTNPEIKKGVDKKLDQKILARLKDCPAWTPGIKDGKAIRKAFLIPIEL